MKIYSRINYAFILILNLFIVTQKGFTNSAITYIESEQELGSSDYCANGDLDNDGDIDVITSHYSTSIKIYLNDGNGQFTLNGQSISIASTWDIALADLDYDGDLDLFITSTTTSNRVYFNDGSGQFTDSGQRFVSLPSMDVELGDVDSDGDFDAIIANFHTTFDSATRNKIWLNDGTGHFSDSGKYLGITVADNLQAGDLNGDGNLDAVIGNTRTPGVKVWLGDGTGNFSATNQIIGTEGYLELADFDGDNDLDLFRGKKNAPNEIWLNNGNGIFEKTDQVLRNLNGYNAEACDMDCDSDMDLIVALGENTPNIIWLNDGNGHFTDSGIQLGNGFSGDVAISDYNNDGLMDIYFSGSPDKVWLCQTTDPSHIRNEIQKSSYFKLYDNYPNPFNPSTTISYSLEKPASVKISIFNSQGQCVKILANSFHPSGEFAVEWDGTDFNGRKVGSGMYFYQLKTDKNIHSKKMIFIQ